MAKHNTMTAQHLLEWQAVDDNIQANSQYHDDGCPFGWWITERGGKVVLHADKELLPRVKSFRSVVEAMQYAQMSENS